MLYVLLYGEIGVAYNISNEDCNVHLKDFARLCAQVNAKDVIFDLPSDVEAKGYSIASYAVLDNGKLKRLGWVPRYSIEKAIRRTLTPLQKCML